jgi:hypothetical protein
MKKPTTTKSKAKPTKAVKPTTPKTKPKPRTPAPVKEERTPDPRAGDFGNVGETLAVLFHRHPKHERFENKTGREISDKVKEAKAGDEDAFIELVEKDRMFLFEPWGQRLVFEADVSGDQVFFNKLAGAIKKKPFKKSPTNEKTLALLETLFQANDGVLLSLIQKPRACRLFHDHLNEQGLIPDTLSDYEYFRKKFLKRHGFLKARLPKRDTK